MKRFIYALLLILPLIAVIGFGVYKKFYVKTVMHHSSISIEQAQAYVEGVLGRKAEFFADEGVFKITIARTDLDVSVHGFSVNPFMGLATWIGFQKGIKKAVEIMAMGDWALLEHELHAVMNVALEHGIKITAIHNHFFGDKPHIYFMHIEVEGTLKDVAAGIYAMQQAMINAVKEDQQPLPTRHAIDGDTIEKIIPVKGTAKDGMFKMVIGRKIKASCGCPVGKNMGINSWIAFGGTHDHAVVDGDFSLFEDEVQPVVKTLKKAGINVVAIHNHMIHEQPRLIYVHFWAEGNAGKIAYGLKDAIDQTTMLNHAQVETKGQEHPCTGCGRVN